MVNLTTSKIYLASKSPRRRELLALIGVDFELLDLEVPEEPAAGESPLAYSQRVCADKAQAAWEYVLTQQLPEYPILTADTEVIYQERILGKPRDYDEAFKMWRSFAGDKHLVLTSVTLKYKQWQKTVTSQSWVYVDQVTDAEIHSYLASGNYQDKSGAYGIQSYAGQFIQKIDGCFFAIMGLPLNSVRHLLLELAANAS
jgi:septum formation protein